VESFDFDPRIEVFDPAGHLLASDDDSGVATNPWLELEVQTEHPVHLSVVSQDGNGGEFLVTVTQGRHAPPAGLERTRATAEFYKAKGLRHLNTGAREKALDSFTKLASLAHELGDTDLIAMAEKHTTRISADARALASANEDLQSGCSLIQSHDMADCEQGWKRLEACATTFRALDARSLELETFACMRAYAARVKDSARDAVAAARCGSLREEAHDIAKARDDFEYALRVLAGLTSPSRDAQATVFSLSGRFFVNRAEYARGLALLERAIEIEPFSLQRIQDPGYRLLSQRIRWPGTILARALPA
jgi:tetratricopeptide (TPR) repeat protein